MDCVEVEEGEKGYLKWLAEVHPCRYRKSNPEVLMVQSSEERLGNDAADGLDRPRNRRILVQR